MLTQNAERCLNPGKLLMALPIRESLRYQAYDNLAHRFDKKHADLAGAYRSCRALLGEIVAGYREACRTYEAGRSGCLDSYDELYYEFYKRYRGIVRQAQLRRRLEARLRDAYLFLKFPSLPNFRTPVIAKRAFILGAVANISGSINRMKHLELLQHLYIVVSNFNKSMDISQKLLATALIQYKTLSKPGDPRRFSAALIDQNAKPTPPAPLLRPAAPPSFFTSRLSSSPGLSTAPTSLSSMRSSGTPL
jgi:hypothetical protein